MLGRKVPNIYRISFGNTTSPKQAEENWDSILDATLPFCTQLNRGLTGGLKNTNTVKEVVNTFRSLVQATTASNKSIYQEFATKITAP